MLGITSLPPEILLEIFSYLPAKDLLDNVSLVCVKWRELVRHPSLWEHFVYTEQHGWNLEDAVRFVEKCPMLKHIHTFLDEVLCPDVQNSLISAVVRNCSDIRSFCVNFGWGYFALSDVHSLFEAFPNLESFEITLGPDSAVEIVERISKNSKLKKLTVRFAYYSEGLLKPIVDHCISLENLRVKGASISEEDHIYILENMKDRLSRVQFSNAQPTTQKVVNALGMFTRLEKLTLTHMPLGTSVDYLPLANIKTLKCFTFFCYTPEISECDTLFYTLFRYPFPLLSKLSIVFSAVCNRTLLQDICLCYPKLKTLSLWCEHPDGTGDKFNEIGRLEQLECLSYPVGRAMTDDDTEHVARCRKLKLLELGECGKLTDKSVANLVKCDSLEYLSLRGCILSGQSLHLLPGHLRHLKTLRLDSKAVDEKDLNGLAELMPTLKICYF